MAAVTIIPSALQGSRSGTLPVSAGTPGHVRFDMVSPDFPTNAALTFAVNVEQSFDGGTNWAPWFANGVWGGGQGTPALKGGAIWDGLWWTIIQWDGLARLARVTITVNTPFTWGVTATVLP